MGENHSAAENVALQSAIAAFCAAPSVQTEERLAVALAKASFLLPVRRTAQDEDGSLHVDVAVLHSSDGGRFPFGFTSREAFALWAQKPLEETSAVSLGFSEMAELLLMAELPYSGFAIDPGGPGQYVLPLRAIAAYSGKAMPVYLAEQSELTLGEPKEFPDALGQAVREVASTLAAVRRLWLLVKLERASGERSFLILADIIGGDPRQVFDRIGRAASAHLPSGYAVELLSAASELGRAALAQHPELGPFYARN